MHATLRRLYTDERKRTMELVSKRIWGFPLMDRKCNTEELSSTRIKTIVFQLIFFFKFCLPERLLTFMVSSHPATNPNIVGPTMLGHAVYRGKDTTHKTLETMCDDACAWPQQCWKSCVNGSNIVALSFGDHATREMLGVVGSNA